MEPSNRQKAVYDCWKNSDKSILINAVAGSGKTSTLLQLLEYCDNPVLFLAFNKSIQEEISYSILDRSITNAKALTLHSLGLRSISYSGVKFQINKNKNYELVDDFFKAHKENRFLKRLYGKNRLELMYFLMDINDISRYNLTNNFDRIYNLFVESGNPVPSIETDNLKSYWNSFLEIRDASYEKNIVSIDFLDMIYCPVIRKLYIPHSPTYLFIDEAQDLSYLQHQFINMFIGQGSIKKFIAVGDRNQSIYGFCGASSNSMDLFLKDFNNIVELPLDICYRCSSLIVEEANKVFNCMTAFKKEQGIVQIENDINLIKSNSMIICRNTGPLIDLYFSLVSNKKATYFRGNDIIEDMIKFLKPYKNYSIAQATQEVEAHLSELSLNNKNPFDIYKLGIYEEKADNFMKLRTGLNIDSENTSVDSFINKLKTLSVSSKDAITLCTIHKSKGLESDVVYILNENLIPSKYAKTDEQLLQEENLRYVARTRAKKELYYLNI